ncbi:hypothetical protein CYMTET_24066 [Cymbomonas tetramitiformis]|uniref:Uncharacterized protein n=1 Tax=Cymbomonas tetramitiformis TaxID=36881 RepID=A0AAE0FX47_9CHLO|nr:hypothetical protein CYMTET_24066 [Cymbomonas tetramitiformis]
MASKLPEESPSASNHNGCPWKPQPGMQQRVNSNAHGASLPKHTSYMIHPLKMQQFVLRGLSKAGILTRQHKFSVLNFSVPNVAD